MKSHLTIQKKPLIISISLCVIQFSKNKFERLDLSKLNKKHINLERRILEKCTFVLLRKEVIHPHVLVGMPCYDLTPIIGSTLDSSLLTVMPPASGISDSHGLTGGVYKPRERIHRGMLIRDY